MASQHAPQGVVPGASPGVGHHVTLRILVATLFVLLVLTAVTVGVTKVDFGPVANLWVAMIIATVKAALVALYFMHLRYDKPFVSVILVTALLFLAIFVGAALMDSRQYRENIESWRAEDPARYAPDLEAGRP